MKRTRITALALSAVLLAGCGQSIGENESISETTTTSAAEAVTTTTAKDDSSKATVTEASSEAEKTIVPEEVAYKKFSETIEAEELKDLPEGVKTAKKRKGYSGKGYITKLDSKHIPSLTFEAPESQYYNISLAVAADKKSACTLNVNELPAGEFTVEGDGKFSLVTLSNISAEKGTVKLSLITDSGAVDLDYIKIEASTDIKKLKLGLEKYSLINKNADSSAKALYEYLCQSFGKVVLTGQHDTVGSMTETRRIYELTGRYPAVRFGDLMPFTQDMIIGENELEYAEKFASEGGIISYMWHWLSPTEGNSCYADETDFDLSKAVTKEKIYDLSLDELKKLNKKKKISDECLAVVGNIDKISKKLAELRDKGIAVIWRPLHEASNGYFWWGHDKESYLWLWKLLYQRQTNYHKLNNLIWVWSAQNADWYVGDKLCDIISADIYDQGNTEGHVEKLLFMRDITAAKPIAMGECGTTPSIQSMADQHAMWSYIGQWGGSYLLNEDASLNEQYNTLESFVKFYSNDLTVTRDELPDFKALAAELEPEPKPAETTASGKTTSAEKKKTSEKETTSEKKTTADKKTTSGGKDTTASEKTAAKTTTKKTTAKTTAKKSS